VHGFLEEPQAFEAYVAAVREQSVDVLEPYVRGDRLMFETPANIAIAQRPE
jgi:hypothetical protein